jgi:hypothetical protein
VSRANKLSLQWRGPQRIVRAIHDYTYEVQGLNPPYELAIRHASRLQFYAESSREITTDLLEHVRHGEGGHLVEKLVKLRKGPDSHVWEVKVLWVGLDPEEATWESLVEMAYDVPVLVTRFMTTLPASKDVEAARKALARATTPARPAQKKGGGSDP